MRYFTTAFSLVLCFSLLFACKEKKSPQQLSCKAFLNPQNQSCEDWKTCGTGRVLDESKNICRQVDREQQIVEQREDVIVIPEAVEAEGGTSGTGPTSEDTGSSLSVASCEQGQTFDGLTLSCIKSPEFKQCGAEEVLHNLECVSRGAFSNRLFEARLSSGESISSTEQAVFDTVGLAYADLGFGLLNGLSDQKMTIEVSKQVPSPAAPINKLDSGSTRLNASEVGQEIVEEALVSQVHFHISTLSSIQGVHGANIYDLKDFSEKLTRAYEELKVNSSLKIHYRLSGKKVSLPKPVILLKNENQSLITVEAGTSTEILLEFLRQNFSRTPS